jgi:hypothetical protein
VLGNGTAAIHRPDWRLLGSGARPAAAHAGRIVDEVDVADLASEASHRYRARLLPSPPLPGQRAVFRVLQAGGTTVADGGRTVAHGESFVLTLPDVPSPRFFTRVLGAGRLELRVDGAPAGALVTRARPDSSSFDERDLALPMLAHRPGPHTVEIVSRETTPFLTFHHWLLDESAGPTAQNGDKR